MDDEESSRSSVPAGPFAVQAVQSAVGNAGSTAVGLDYLSHTEVDGIRPLDFTRLGASCRGNRMPERLRRCVRRAEKDYFIQMQGELFAESGFQGRAGDSAVVHGEIPVGADAHPERRERDI